MALLGANNDINEASSISYKRNIVDIYSNSWGPPDTGALVEGPGYLTQLALQIGAKEVIKAHMKHCCFYVFCIFLRDVMGKGLFLYGLVVMVEKMMIVQLMAILKVYTPSLLELLVWMVMPVHLMKSAHQKWLLHM